MPGKDGHTARNISILPEAKKLGENRDLFVDAPGSSNSQHADPIEQLHKNIGKLRNLTGELAFMVKEIGKLTSKS